MCLVSLSMENFHARCTRSNVVEVTAPDHQIATTQLEMDWYAVSYYVGSRCCNADALLHLSLPQCYVVIAHPDAAALTPRQELQLLLHFQYSITQRAWCLNTYRCNNKLQNRWSKTQQRTTAKISKPQCITMIIHQTTQSNNQPGWLVQQNTSWLLVGSIWKQSSTTDHLEDGYLLKTPHQWSTTV